MKFFYCILLFSFNSIAFGQKVSRFEPCINLGIRNNGIMFSYSIFQALDIHTGIKIVRFNNFGIFTGFKIYPLKKFKNIPLYGGTPFLGMSYNYIFSSKYNKEDSRKYVNSFYVPSNNSIIAEIGYRFNHKPEKMFKKFNSALGLGLSLLYQKNLDFNYKSSLILGAYIDEQGNKINNFMKGGIGFNLSLYLLIEKIK
jgi:hypothetical protein